MRLALAPKVAVVEGDTAVAEEDKAVAEEDKAVAEALTFCGIEAGELDVTFLPAGAPATGAMERAALAFDIPAPASRTAQIVTPAAPGTDPSRPPKLR